MTKEELERHGGLEAYIREVECQEIQVEPLVIRVNAGDCIEIRLTNLLPEMLMESPFQMETITDIAGYHIHLVKFDTIVSDGAMAVPSGNSRCSSMTLPFCLTGTGSP